MTTNVGSRVDEIEVVEEGKWARVRIRERAAQAITAKCSIFLGSAQLEEFGRWCVKMADEISGDSARVQYVGRDVARDAARQDGCCETHEALRRDLASALGVDPGTDWVAMIGLVMALASSSKI